MTNKARKRALRRRVVSVMAESKALSKARYYSHVLYFPTPARKPFDKEELRWASFIGEFVAPLVLASPGVLYWFSDYTTRAHFRVFTTDYAGLRKKLEPLRDRLGLVDKGEEKDATLEGDLGHSRFWEPHSRVTRRARAEALLRALKAGSDLMVQSVQPRADGYWEFEGNGDPGLNPVSNNRFSIVHLFHNLMDSKARVFLFQDASGSIDVLSQYYFLQAMNNKSIAPVAYQHRDILM